MATPQVDDDDVRITVAAVAVASDDDGDGGHDGNEESYSGNDDVGATVGRRCPIIWGIDLSEEKSIN